MGQDGGAIEGELGAQSLAVLLVGKEVQEWALHVGRLFDGVTFLEALDRIRRAILGGS